MLELQGAVTGYGSKQVLHAVSLTVPDSGIVALVGRNGVGKSTTLRVISGLLPLQGGAIRLDGERLSGLAPEAVARRGVIHVPEGRRVFATLSVRENLEVATVTWRRLGQSCTEDLDRVFALFPHLLTRERAAGWSLSGGEQQMLAIGRGLMARPRTLLLDEPSLGLAPLVVQEVLAAIRSIARQGVSVLLVEQNAQAALRLADKAYVMEGGRINLQGSGSEILANAAFREAYLGISAMGV